MTDASRSDPRVALKSVQLIHRLLTSGMVIFGIVLLVLINAGGAGTAESPPPGETLPVEDGGGAPQIFLLVAGALSVTMVLPVMMFGPSLVRKVITNEQLSPVERTSRYVGTRLMLAALVEGPGLFWGVLALISKDALYLSGLGFSIFVMLAIAPRAAEWEDAGFDLHRPPGE